MLIAAFVIATAGHTLDAAADEHLLLLVVVVVVAVVAVVDVVVVAVAVVIVIDVVVIAVVVVVAVFDHNLNLLSEKQVIAKHITSKMTINNKEKMRMCFS